MNLDVISREKLHKELRRKIPHLKKNAVLMTYFQVVERNKIEVELCQKRCVEKRIFRGRYTLPNLDSHYSLLSDRLFFTPDDFVQSFPELGMTSQSMQKIIDKGHQQILGEPLVYFQLKIIKKIFRPQFGRFFTPVITALEYTESELYKNFSGSDVNEDIEKELLNQNHVLTEDGSALRDGKTGEKIFRFTKTEYIEDSPRDKVVPYKMREIDFDEMKSGKDYLSWEW